MIIHVQENHRRPVPGQHLRQDCPSPRVCPELASALIARLVQLPLAESWLGWRRWARAGSMQAVVPVARFGGPAATGCLAEEFPRGARTRVLVATPRVTRVRGCPRSISRLSNPGGMSTAISTCPTSGCSGREGRRSSSQGSTAVASTASARTGVRVEAPECRSQGLAGSTWVLRSSGAASGEIMNLIIARAASCSFEAANTATLDGHGLFRKPGSGPT